MECICNTRIGPDFDVASICIGQLWIFQNLQPHELLAITKTAQRKIYQKGQSIFFQGDKAEQMFLLKAGRVKLSKITAEGEEITLDIRKSGDFLGETMLTEDINYPLSAICLEDTLTCGFTKTGFEKLILEHANIGLQVIKNLSKRIASLTSRVGSLSLSHLEDRLYNVLINVAHEHGIKNQKGYIIQFPLTHEELGFLVGVHRVSITRAMKLLRESGKIKQEGRTLILI
ncbi:MAG: Crp/Fnr family transcriptional regulator [Deltaproteobacteria bacterium]|nr:Crp/Fnr family transcriptional regulator [Deltaproteobacteria bacterium]